MAEGVEPRRAIIEYENRITGDLGSLDNGSAPTLEVTPELVEAIRRELLRIGTRNLHVGLSWGGLPSLTVEVAFSTDPGATPVWTNITPTVRECRIRRGRQHELDRVEAGTASIVLHDVDGRYSPSNTLGPYYPNVLPMRRIRIRGTFGAQTFDVFHGYVEAWPQEWEFSPRSASTVTIQAVDAFKVLALANVNTTRSSELSGTRVGAILDAISWPAADRAIDAGESVIQGVTLENTSALSHLSDVDLTEGGVFFISRDGKATFLDRTKFGTAALDATNHTWGDSGIEKPYGEIRLSFDDSQLWNDVKVTAPGKTDETATDTASQTRFFLRTLVLSGLWDDQNEMEDRANYSVTRYSQPALRVNTLSIHPQYDDTQWEHLLHHDLHEKVRVRRRPTDTITISQDSYIEGISHDIGPGRWIITLNLSPLDHVTDYWIWDTSLWGVSTRWYW